MEIALSCDIPGTMERMELNSNAHLIEMFSLHRKGGYVHVYVRHINAEIKVNLIGKGGNNNNNNNEN